MSRGEGGDTAAERLARQIRRLRGEADLSQSDLAHRIGYSPQYVSLAERTGKGLPSAALVQAIDKALGAGGELVALGEEARAERRARRHTGSPATRAPVVWFCVNLRDGGMTVTPALGSLPRRHGVTSFDWLRRFPEILGCSPLGPPDVVFLQEAKFFDQHGDELLLFVERQLHLHGYGPYRGFLTRLGRSPHHQAVFLNTDRLHAVHHWRGADPDEPRDLNGFVEVIVDGEATRTLWLRSVHLDPRDGDVRLAEAKQIHAAVPAGQRALLAGDFNSITSRRGAAGGEPQPDFGTVPAHLRYHLGTWPPAAPDGATGADTRALDYLIDCGWTCQHSADGNVTPTTLPDWERGGALIIDRCLATSGLATVPGSVWVDTSSTPYSDHRAFGGAVTIADGGTA